MPRGWASLVKTAMAQPVYHDRILVRMDLASGVKRWWSGRRDLPWQEPDDIDRPDGTSVPITTESIWEGSGPLLKVGGIRESIEPDSSLMIIQLLAHDQNAIVWARENIYGREARIWFAFLDENGELIPSPKTMYVGHMSHSLLEHLDDGSVAQIYCEQRSIDMARSAPALRTDQDQRDRFPGDSFFAHVAKLVDLDLVSPGAGYKPPKN